MTIEPRPPAEDTRRPIQKFLGCVAMAFGALIISLCGLCTARFWGPALWNLTNGGRVDGGAVALAVIITAVIDLIPVTLGILIFRGGLRIYGY